ncbi:serine/threonine-protein phosphatase 6 regulatory ankyrin repeat subunit B-like, partial [Thalassophryne amazonica]|uniref:serine/threonine-protein phosphatase 6 regulatory ankyrin repeat subunit B-like n=1 Tax=Thalassophryne amazonica TaxID=390379 RepID=UPI001470EEAD
SSVCVLDPERKRSWPSRGVCLAPQLLCAQEESIQCLLEQEASVLLSDSRGRTAVHLAAARGHASWLSELLSAACSEPPSLPPLKDHGGYTPLHWACYYGHEGCVEVLLEQKDCCCLGGNPFTPLHCAVVNNHESCASLLLDALGSDITLCVDAKGRTPLHAAAFSGHVDCVHLLLSHNAPVNAVDHTGRSALMMAAAKGRLVALEVLLSSATVNLTLTDKDGNSALHLACLNGKEECVLLILEKLPEPTLINASNAALQTPLHLAARSGLKRTVQELLSRGASVQTLDEDASTDGFRSRFSVFSVRLVL